MSSENGTTDVSEMRENVDPVQIGVAENVSEMQEYPMEYTEEKPEDIKYRVVMADFGYSNDNDTLCVEYYSNFDDANADYDAMTEDKDFIKHHDQTAVIVMLDKCYRGMSMIFWETIRKAVVYNSE